MRKKILTILLLAAELLSLTGCSENRDRAAGVLHWSIGFADAEIEIPETEMPLYIAGYKNGKEITGVRDLPRATAVWMDDGNGGVLLIGVDCIALSSDTVEEIRSGLRDFTAGSGCRAINVFATHTHESVDTLGLWGPVGFDGKNPDFQKNLIRAAVNAGQSACRAAQGGRLYYGETETADLLEDSRDPQVYDPMLRQLRFEPDSGGAGIRILFFPAHAESMRSGNTLVSRDYPGVVSDAVKEACGDSVLFVPGAVGGLIMTKVLTEGTFDAEENVTSTGNRIAEYALSIPREEETEVAPRMEYVSTELEIPLDNTLFMYYRFLGVLRSDITAGKGATGYSIHSPLSVLLLDGIAVCMIPGEIFPELVFGNGLGTGDPEALSAIALEYGIGKLLIAGLCNDELGYIIPPSNYLLSETLPYVEGVKDATGENHYEETNSVGLEAAGIIADGFRNLMKQLKE